MHRMRWRLVLMPLFTICLLTLLMISVGVAAPLRQEPPQELDIGQEYVVKAGDSLSKISWESLGSQSAYPLIVDATNAKAESDPRFARIVDPSVIRVGQLLWIPNDPEEAVQPSARFVTPVDGAVVSPTFDVEMAVEGLTIEPAGEIHENAGHFHILVDTDFVAPGELLPFDDNHLHFGQGQMTTTQELDPGVHTLRLQVANGAHIALEGEPYRDVITVTVAGEEAVQPSVRFVTPVDGAVVSPTFDVEMAVEGLTIEPAGEIHENAGHFHILVDTDFVAPGELVPSDENHLHFGQGQMTTTQELDPGVHTLRLQVANGAHIALEGEPYRDVITVTVAGEEAVQPSVRFVTPVDGAVVSPTFDVEMAVEGLTIEPAGEIHENAGHFHILVDTDFVAPGELVPSDENHLHFGQGQMTTTQELDPGVHTLRLQVANGAHIALEGEPYRDVITVTVGPGL